MYPPLKEFRKLWKEHDRITVYKEMGGDMDTPVSMLAKFLPFEKVALLESAEQDKTYSRFSFLAFKSGHRLVLKDDGIYRDGERLGPLAMLGEVISPSGYLPTRGTVTFPAATSATSPSSSWGSAAS
jgi:anthranilate synthase component 1